MNSCRWVLDADYLQVGVFTSRREHTTTTVVCAGQRALVVDPAWDPDELGWIADDLARIEGALDEVLTQTNTSPDQVDKVFLTGGTSFVPAVRSIFTRRFDASKIESGGELLSIAHGLAMVAQEDDIAAWVS